MNKFAIFTAVVGNYDEIHQPLVVDPRFDYYLFSDTIKEERIGVWQVRSIPYSNEDTTRVARFVKTHPSELLEGYEASLWIDANIQILSDYIYGLVIDLYEKHIQISSMCHPDRDCIYDEAFAVMNMMVEHESVVLKWCHFLKRANYPQHNGLCETNVLFRINNSVLQDVDSLWWSIIDQNSRRDQLSFNYVLWKIGLSCHFMLGQSHNVRNSSHFKLIPHIKTLHNHCYISRNEAWLMRHCWKYEDDTDMVRRVYFKLYGWPFPQLVAFCVGQYFRIIDRLRK